MTLRAAFCERLDALAGDPELARNSPHLDVTVAFDLPGGALVFRCAEGGLRTIDGSAADIRIAASADAWRRLLADPQPPRHTSFTALQIANPDFDVSGDPALIAQARAALDRLVESLSNASAATATAYETDLGQITGHYAMVDVAGMPHRYYYETAGAGDLPVIFLHTAGADSRQYLWQMADVDLARRFRLFAPDMPCHGRSMPPEAWDGGPYYLTAARYREWVAAFIKQIVGGPALLIGGSMGAAIALVMAADRPDLTRAVIAVEPPFRSPGRRNAFQDHVAVHAGLHNSAFIRGLMSPTSPLARRRAASWIYTQGAPGVYRGDLAFYSDEFDGSLVGPRIDATRTPVAMLSGAYDFSATPEDGAKLARHIPGALHLVMDRLGHFPATEHPAMFRPWLLQALDHISARLEART